MTDTPTLLPESTFTAARPDCPHPGRWHARDPESAEHEVSELVAAMVTALRPDVVVETGTHVGATAAAVGRALADAGHGHLHTVEQDAALAAVARQACTGLPVTVHHTSSLLWEPPAPIDVAWLDSHPDIRADELRRLRRWMHHRTVVGVHDIGPQHVVRAGIEQLVGERLIEPPLWLPTPRGVCWARVIPGGG